MVHAVFNLIASSTPPGPLASVAKTPGHDVWFRGSAVTDWGQTADRLFMHIIWFSAFCFVVLMLLMVYWAYRWRRRPGVPAPRSPSHNTPLELAWTILPLGILAVMFFRGFWGYMGFTVAPANALEMNLSGFKWGWTLTYPNGANSPLTTKNLSGAPEGAASTHVRDYPIFFMPADVPVRLRMNSQDVMHSFWVPSFRLKFDLLPNRYTAFTFKAAAPTGNTRFADGDFKGEPYEDHWVFCAEYCGDMHSEMAAIIRVVDEKIYRKVVESWAIPADGTPDVIGPILWKAKGCNACHTIDGNAGTGPTWKGIYMKEHEFTDGTKAIADETYLRESIEAPGTKIVKGFQNQMPPYKGVLSEKEINYIIDYIKLLNPGAPTPPDSPPASGTKP